MIAECLRCGTPLDPKWIRCPVCIGEEATDPTPVLHLHEEIPLRDWFAGMAIQGMLHNGFMPNEADEPGFNYVKAAYKIADAMMRERGWCDSKAEAKKACMEVMSGRVAAAERNLEHALEQLEKAKAL